MQFVLTNDDGIDAPGLASLEAILRPLGQVTVVAPDSPQSGAAHQITTVEPIEVRACGAGRFSVGGTPADCSRLALRKLAPSADWVIAGINPGANLGSDVYNSGTVAAAREATILGCRAVAISQYISKGGTVDWQATGHHAGRVLGTLFSLELAAKHLWNVNLPHPIGLQDRVAIEYCGLDTLPHDYDYSVTRDWYTYQGTIHERPREPHKDVAVCFDEHKIAVTRIPIGT